LRHRYRFWCSAEKRGGKLIDLLWSNNGAGKYDTLGDSSPSFPQLEARTGAEQFFGCLVDDEANLRKHDMASSIQRPHEPHLE
jgi:hypothetical protein